MGEREFNQLVADICVTFADSDEATMNSFLLALSDIESLPEIPEPVVTERRIYAFGRDVTNFPRIPWD